MGFEKIIVRLTSQIGVEIRRHLVGKNRTHGVIFQNILCMTVTHLGVAYCDKVEHAGFHQIICDGAATVPNAAASQIDALVRFEFRGTAYIRKSGDGRGCIPGVGE